MSVSDSMSQFSGELNNLVENDYNDSEMMHTTENEDVIRVLQSIAPSGKKLGQGTSKPDMKLGAVKKVVAENGKRYGKLTEWDAKFEEYSAFSGMPAIGTTWYLWQSSQLGNCQKN